jgi:quercetin dioxygenase-like cupin family protein
MPSNYDYEDERGYIRDLVVREDFAITEIFTKAGAVRGNHVHHNTTQWAYVQSGEMLFASEESDLVMRLLGPGGFVEEPPGIPHAWKANEDTVVLVVTRGPRSGPAYESDTVRLEKPLL